MEAIVTGTSSGIGQAIALKLLATGWTVHGLDVAPARIDHAGFDATPIDLRDGAAVEAAATRLSQSSALVHAGGVMRVGLLGALKADDAELMWRIHVDAAARMANVLLPAMAARGHGRVVMIGSRVAAGVAGRSQYAATKAALVGMGRSWAAEVVAQGVTVNIVSPAATETAMLQDPARRSESPKLPPMGRLIKPEEIAATVAFLLSPDAAPITGQDIQVCGGSSLPR